MTTKEIGDIGEEAAVNFLLENGYTILERNWHAGHLEIDIVALQGDFLVIVEVKTRVYNSLISAHDSVTKDKQKFLIQAANSYVRKKNRHEEIRMDVICVVHHNGEVVEIEHIKSAFYPRLRTCK